LPVAASHFEIESDVLLAFARADCAIEFAPIEVIYKSEQSKIHPVRDTVRWIKWWRTVRVAKINSERRSVRLSPVGTFNIQCSTSNIEQPTTNIQ